MYSDRVDSVTRATNPSLLPSLPSTPLARSSLLVRRPPPLPTRHLPMYQRIKHSLSIRPSSSSVVSFFLPSFSRHLLSCFNAHSSHFPYSLTAPQSIFLLLIPLRCILIRSRCFFHYFVISSYLSFSPFAFSVSSFFFLTLDISLLLIISHLGNSLA